MLTDAGWDVELVEIHGGGHDLSTIESRTQILELILEDIKG
jgi:dipeptidyl aminopeptidase/acylaminoacyl peptidase